MEKPEIKFDPTKQNVGGFYLMFSGVASCPTWVLYNSQGLPVLEVHTPTTKGNTPELFSQNMEWVAVNATEPHNPKQDARVSPVPIDWAKESDRLLRLRENALAYLESVFSDGQHIGIEVATYSEDETYNFVTVGKTTDGHLAAREDLGEEYNDAPMDNGDGCIYLEYLETSVIIELCSQVQLQK